MNKNLKKSEVMKKAINKILKAFAILLLVGTSYTALSQPPPPPDGGGDGESGGNELGGEGPSGSGLLILAALGTAYGIRRWNVYKLESADGEKFPS